LNNHLYEELKATELSAEAQEQRSIILSIVDGFGSAPSGPYRLGDLLTYGTRGLDRQTNGVCVYFSVSARHP
ncbi:MAG: hypothetical protein AAGH38_10025, partial [Pseudomonadota bacterium]